MNNLTDTHASEVRHLPLEGASNFRDFGGYETRSGRVVTGRLFRSDRLSLLTSADFDKLNKLNLRWVIDLRRSSELERDPTRWQGSDGPELWHLPLIEDDSGRRNALQLIADDPAKRNSAEAAIQVMADMYRDLVNMPFSRGQYAAMFNRMAAEGSPGLVVHCSAGKDRTGIVVALIQLALGVTEDQVIEDFMLTDRYYDGARLMHERSSQLMEHEEVDLSEAALLPVFTIHREYLQAALDEIDSAWGGTENYFRKGLGLTPDVIPALQEQLIEE